MKQRLPLPTEKSVPNAKSAKVSSSFNELLKQTLRDIDREDQTHAESPDKHQSPIRSIQAGKSNGSSQTARDTASTTSTSPQLGQNKVNPLQSESQQLQQRAMQFQRKQVYGPPGLQTNGNRLIDKEPQIDDHRNQSSQSSNIPNQKRMRNQKRKRGPVPVMKCGICSVNDSKYKLQIIMHHTVKDNSGFV